MRLSIAALIALLLTNTAGASPADSSPAPRPAAWAQPVTLAGVPNLHKVNGQFYRSAQPTDDGMKALKKLGVETVVNLRSFHSDRDELEGTGIGYEHIYMKVWHPEEKEMVRFLQIVTNEKRQPILLHCKHGADRTGQLCAVYRITVQGWTKEQAIAEMTDGGFNFHPIWTNIVKYVEELDVNNLRENAGIATSRRQTDEPLLRIEKR